ncbi:Uncharacterised protein [Orientia tsutsugamushi]|uniref:Uncharacterized protein n=1 Tax=Orientia tsutsugamushi TaxID=784 RepID=A0A2U3R4T8_ORITS|nr:hypothetical protein [Orientia tsutsugamushi]SPR08231.1 Uncharacterised protein [Orientia tsutsugamushi]
MKAKKKKHNKVVNFKNKTEKTANNSAAEQQIIEINAAFSDKIKKSLYKGAVLESIFACALKTEDIETLKIIESQNIKINTECITELFVGFITEFGKYKFAIQWLQEQFSSIIDDMITENPKIIKCMIIDSCENRDDEFISFIIKNYSNKIDVDEAFDNLVTLNFGHGITLLLNNCKVTQESIQKAIKTAQTLGNIAAEKILNPNIKLKKPPRKKKSDIQYHNFKEAEVKDKFKHCTSCPNDYEIFLTKFFKIVHSCNKNDINNFINDCEIHLQSSNEDDKKNYVITFLEDVLNYFILPAHKTESLTKVILSYFEAKEDWYNIAVLHINRTFENEVFHCEKAIDAVFKINKTSERDKYAFVSTVLKYNILDDKENWARYLKFSDKLQKFSTGVYNTLNTAILYKKISTFILKGDKSNAEKYIEKLPESLPKEIINLEYRLNFDSKFDYSNEVQHVYNIKAEIDQQKLMIAGRILSEPVLRVLIKFWQHFDTCNNDPECNEIQRTYNNQQCNNILQICADLAKYHSLSSMQDDITNLLNNSSIKNKPSSDVIVANNLKKYNTADKRKNNQGISLKKESLNDHATTSSHKKNQVTTKNELEQNVETKSGDAVDFLDNVDTDEVSEVDKSIDNSCVKTGFDRQYTPDEFYTKLMQVYKKHPDLFTRHDKHQHIHCHTKKHTYCTFDPDVKKCTWNGKTYYCAISKDLKLDSVKHMYYRNALEKEFVSSNINQSGIKCLPNKMFELKVCKEDFRLLACNTYVDNKGNYFIIFNKETNHTGISNIISNSTLSNDPILTESCKDCNDEDDSTTVNTDITTCEIGQILNQTEYYNDC